MKLKDKVVLISGGCSGIGRATALRFSEEGAKVIIGDLNTEGFPDISQHLDQMNASFACEQLDVRDENSWKNLFKIGLEKFSRIDCVVNNAGIAIPGSVESMSLDEWNAELDVNLTGTFLGIKHAIINLKDSGGSIINLSSIEGIIGHPGYAAYSAGKAGVRNLTKSAALHVASQNYNIRVNSVHPGYIETPMIGSDSKELVELRKLHPIGRLGQPKDIANVILFLASDDSAFVTGSELVVDGGFLAQ